MFWGKKFKNAGSFYSSALRKCCRWRNLMVKLFKCLLLMAYLTWLAFSDLLMKPVSLSRWVMALKESGLVWGDWRATYGWGIKINTNPLISSQFAMILNILTTICSCLPECISERSKGHSWDTLVLVEGRLPPKVRFQFRMISYVRRK